MQRNGIILQPSANITSITIRMKIDSKTQILLRCRCRYVIVLGQIF